jgi:hypothetical protein
MREGKIRAPPSPAVSPVPGGGTWCRPGGEEGEEAVSWSLKPPPSPSLPAWDRHPVGMEGREGWGSWSVPTPTASREGSVSPHSSSILATQRPLETQTQTGGAWTREPEPEQEEAAVEQKAEDTSLRRNSLSTCFKEEVEERVDALLRDLGRLSPPPPPPLTRADSGLLIDLSPSSGAAASFPSILHPTSDTRRALLLGHLLAQQRALATTLTRAEAVRSECRALQHRNDAHYQYMENLAGVAMALERGRRRS